MGLLKTIIKGLLGSCVLLAALTPVKPLSAGTFHPIEEVVPLEIGPLTIGGAVRANYIYKDWTDDHYKHGGDIDLDTLRINIDLEKDNWIGSFEYRFYRTEAGAYSFHADGSTSDNDFWYTFLHHGWLGYRFDNASEIHVGVHQVPFGIQPYASHNWFFQLPYYVGLEDDYDLGVKFIKPMDQWNLKLAFYLRDEGHWKGQASSDSARYSYDLVEDPVYDGTSPANEEAGQFNARLTYTFEHAENCTTEVGASAQYGLIDNGNTDKTGDHYAGALHLNGNYGRWNLMLQAIRYEYDVENDPALDTAPPYKDGTYVVMGAYDAPYRVASEAWIYCAGISYTLPVEWKYIDSLTFYDDYSILVKDESGFGNTQQNVVGCMIAAGRFFTYVDVAAGRNHPWLGPTWSDGLAAGGDTGWHTRFNINVGYYF